ncbi:MAG: hypothetical protein ACLGIZ_07145 [Acidimicrobiia bacterium]
MSRRPGPVTASVLRARDHVVVRWSAGDVEGSCRFDHLPGTTPAWLGSAEELLDGADRRLEGRVLDAVAELARTEGLQLGLWHDDQGVELLG